MSRLSLVAASGGYFLVAVQGFSLQWFLLLWSTGSRASGLSSCGAWTWLLYGMWNLPQPAIEPVLPTLVGFLTPGPPVKTNTLHLDHSLQQTV